VAYFICPFTQTVDCGQRCSSYWSSRIRTIIEV